MLTNPLISVVMPVYNGEAYLKQAIDSILEQTERNFEFIVINDGSTDQSEDILNIYTQKDARILLHSHENRGLITTLNEGINFARGKYIARMDADDISLPTRFEEQVSFLESNPDVGVLGTAFQTIDDTGKLKALIQHPPNHWEILWHLCFHCPIGHPTVMLRANSIQNISQYNEEMKDAEDYDYWIRLSKITNLANLKKILLLHRIHGKSISSIKWDIQRSISIRISHNYIQDLLKIQIPISIVERIWNLDFSSQNQVSQTTDLLLKLFSYFNTLSNIPFKEIQAIREDAFRRLYWIFQAKPNFSTFLKMMSLCDSEDYFLALRIITKKVMKVRSPV